jgi:hypothetical protein
MRYGSHAGRVESPSVGRFGVAPHRWRPLAAATVLVFLHAGLAIASIPDASGVFHACYQKSSGTMRIIDTAKASCKKAETEITWSQQGPAGQTGPRGPSDAYLKDQRSSFSAITISQTQPTTILTLSALPPGTYVVTATAAIVATATTTSVTTVCALADGADGRLSDSIQVTNGQGSGVNAFADIALTTAFTFATTDDVKIRCQTTGDNTQSQPSAITAIKVGDLH